MGANYKGLTFQRRLNRPLSQMKFIAKDRDYIIDPFSFCIIEVIEP